MSSSTAWRTSKNTALLLTGHGLRMASSFAFVLYSAAILGVDGFGRFALATHYLELFLSLAATAVGILVIRDLARWKKHLDQLVTSAAVLLLGLSLLFMILMWALPFGFGYPSETATAIWIASLALFPAAFCTLLEAIFLGFERAEFVTLGMAVEGTFRVLVSCVALYLGFGLFAVLWILVVSRVVLLLCYGLSLRRIAVPRWEFRRRRCLWLVSRWRMFAAENWLATVYTSLDVVVLSIVAGEAAVGLYTAAWKIIRLGTLAAYSYTTAVFPVLSRLYAESRPQFHKLSRDTVRYMIVLALPAIAAVAVLQQRVIDVLYTVEYRDAGPVLSVLMWVMLLLFINPFFSYTLFARGQQRASMNVAALSLVVNLLTTPWLASHWGAVGAAYGTLLGGLVALGGYCWYALQAWEIRELAEGTLRVAVAAAGLGATLFLARDWPLPALVVLGAIAYSVMLLLVGVIRATDLLTLRTRWQTRANG